MMDDESKGDKSSFERLITNFGEKKMNKNMSGGEKRRIPPPTKKDWPESINDRTRAL
jgi:hypothetical protein